LVEAQEAVVAVAVPAVIVQQQLLLVEAIQLASAVVAVLAEVVAAHLHSV
jgi:hypothetical protein